MVMLGGRFYSGKKAKDGEVITILDEGKWVESQFKKPDGSPKNAFQMSIEVNGEKHTFTLNKKNSDVLIASWGNDTQLWIGKRAKVHLKDTEIAGEDVIAIRLTPLTESGTEEAIDPEPDWGDK